MKDKKPTVTLSASGQTREFYTPVEYYQYLRENPTLFVEGCIVEFNEDTDLDDYLMPAIESV